MSDSDTAGEVAVLTSHDRLITNFQRLYAGSNAVHHQDITITLKLRLSSSDGEISYYLTMGDRNGKPNLATVSVQCDVRAKSF